MKDLLEGETKHKNPNPLQWQHPFRCTVSGASETGKTVWLLNKLQDKHSPFHKIIWCAPTYSLNQPKLKNFANNFGKDDVIFIDGLNTDEIDKNLNDFNNQKLQTALVLDDLMYEQNNYINNLLTLNQFHK
jgi:hypothetical protein